MIHIFLKMAFWLLNDAYGVLGVSSVYQSQTGYLNFVQLSYIEISVSTTKVQKKVSVLQARSIENLELGRKPIESKEFWGMLFPILECGSHHIDMFFSPILTVVV